MSNEKVSLVGLKTFHIKNPWQVELEKQSVILGLDVQVISATTRDLDIHKSQIYDWHNKFQQKKSASQREANEKPTSC